MQRFEVIKPLLLVGKGSRRTIEDRAKVFNIHATTIYRWMVAFRKTGSLSSLVPPRRADKGKSRLVPEVEKVIDEVIESHYLTKQRKSAARVVREIRKVCFDLGLEAPSDKTVRKRIQRVPDRKAVEKRYGLKQARSQFDPIEGSVPGADAPFDLLEIDHTLLDLELVDDVYRLPIGRPWLTLTMDVFSRMIAGFYLSFERPGALATGLCLSHAMLPKTAWLQKQGVEGTWPCEGIPLAVLSDNAKEFKGEMLERACRENQIDPRKRPPGIPWYGGNIERLFRTISEEIHALPGTTFSNPQERARYDSEGKAFLTLSEFERWLATYIVQVYHATEHSSIHTTPLARYLEGVATSSSLRGHAVPRPVADSQKLRLDFMPYYERTVQNYGVSIATIKYFDDVLRRWIHATNPESRKSKREFIFRWDPRDISQIWFYDPELRTYFAIPYRNITHPPISMWELREIVAYLKKQGRAAVDEQAIFRARDRLKEIEDRAAGRTKSARRAISRRISPEATDEPKTRAKDPSDEALDFDSVAPFEDMKSHWKYK